MILLNYWIKSYLLQFYFRNISLFAGKVWHSFCIMIRNSNIMKRRAITYFSKNRALKILEHPIESDLQTFLSATFALSRNRVVKNHIHNTLIELSSPAYKQSA